MSVLGDKYALHPDSSLNVTLDLSAPTLSDARDGGRPQAFADLPTSTPSPNPYKRRVSLSTRSPTRRYDADRGGVTSAGGKKSLRRGLESGVGNARRVVYIGEQNSAGGSASPTRCSPPPSRSISPDKKPWCPSGRRSSGGNFESIYEGAHAVHPNFRRSSTDTSRARDGQDIDVYRGRGPHGRHSIDDSSPPSTATLRRPEIREAEPVVGRRGSRANHEVSKIETRPDRRQWMAGGSVYGATNGVPSTTPVNASRSSPKPVRVRAHSNEQARPKLDERQGTAGGSGGRPGDSRGSIAEIRRRVRGLQALGGRASVENDPRSSAGGRRRSSVQLSTVYAGHDGQVLALARHGALLFSAAADGTAKAWDTNSFKCLATYRGHQEAVWGIQVTSRTLITGGADGTVRFWDIETARPLHVMDLGSAVRDVVVVGDFLAVATSCADIEVIDLQGMSPHRKLHGHLLAVSALASLDGGKLLVSGSHDTFVRIWDPATGECDAVLGGHGGTVGALCVIPCPRDRHNAGDRRRTAPNAEELIVSGSGDATVRVWSRASWAEVGEWTCLAVLEGHRHGVWAVHGSAVSGIFATGGGDATLKIWAPKATVDPCREAESTPTGMAGGERGQSWECVGGVRGVVGAVGAVLMTEEKLLFGTTEALIAEFPLQSCMPVRW